MISRIKGLIRILCISLLITVCSFSTAFAQVDIGALQGVLNGMITSQQVNQSNNPKLADRNEATELVDPVSGALTLKQNDLSLAGKDGLDLSIGRIYNSSQAEYGTKKVTVTSSSSSWTETKTGWYVQVTAYDVATGDWKSYTDGPFNTQAEANANVVTYADDEVWIYSAVYDGTYQVYYSDYTVTTTNYPDGYNYLRSRYDLGAGWSFAFPSVEIVEEQGNKFLSFHDGTGAVYQVTATPDTSDSNLSGYQGKDVEFCEDNGSYSNGQVTSKYKFISSDKKTTYFASDGRLIGIKDRFGNEIKFTHTNRTIHGISYPYISNIVDSVGRNISFAYENTIENATGTAGFPGEKISVTVNDPGNTKSISLVYLKGITAIEYVHSNGQNETYYEPFLTSYTNPNNQKTIYKDNNPTGYDYIGFMFSSKDVTRCASIPLYLLGGVQYLNTCSFYQYESTTRNLGPDGAVNTYRVKARYDKEWKYNTSTSTWSPEGDINHINYAYSGDCTGYPSYSCEEALPESYQFWSQASLSNGIVTRSTYNGKKKQIQEETTASNGEKKVVKNLEYDLTFNQKPTKVEFTEYASDGTVSSQQYIARTYNDWGGISTVTQPLNTSQLNDPNTKSKYTTTYGYEPVCKFVLSKQWYQNDATPLSESYSYDSLQRISSITNAKGESVNYNYTLAPDGRSIAKTTITKQLENGKTAKNELYYDTSTNYAYPSIVKDYYTNEQGVYTESKTTRTYNMLLGLITTDADNSNRTTTYAYDNLGRVTLIILPNVSNINGKSYSVKQTFQYTDGSYYSAYVDPSNKGIASSWIYTKTIYKDLSNNTELEYNTVESAYDGYGNLRQEQKWDADNGTWKWIVTKQYRNDSLCRPVYFVDAENNPSTYGYDSWGRLCESTDSLSNLYSTNYDNKNHKVYSYFVAQSNVTSYRNNNTDNSLKESYIETSLDQWDRVVERKAFPHWPNTTGAISEKYTYDISGNVVTYTDPKSNLNEDGVTKKYTYDQLGRVTQVKDALGQITEASYSVLGDISSIKLKENSAATQAIELYKKSYDELGQITAKTDPMSQSSTYAYNSLGLNTKTTDRNSSVFNYGYDEHNQITSNKGVAASGTGSTEYKYLYLGAYGASRVQEYINDSSIGLTDYSYGGSGQTTNKNTFYSSNNYNSYLKNDYDKAGRLKNNAIAKDGTNYFYTNYSYIQTRLDKVQTNGAQAADATGKAYASYNYYPDGKLESITYPTLSDGTILKTSHVYDKLNRLQTIANKKGSTILSQYTYTYDSNGNTEIVTDNISNKSTQYKYDKLDRLQEINNPDRGVISYTYDLRGNRKTMAGNIPFDLESASYSYDLRNKLTQATKGSMTISISYNTEGLRYKKSSPLKTVQYHYNMNGQVIAEGDNTGSIKANYVWGPDRTLVKKDTTTGQDYYYLYNGHGDVVQMVDTTGNIVNNYSYDEWGNILNNTTETIENPFKYAGEIYDAETGLYYLRARYYDPQMGRFINEDSYEGQVNNPLTLNQYTYGNNNPMMYIDPSGNMGIGQFFKNFLPGFIAGMASFDDLKNLFNGNTISAIKEFGTALINGAIKVNDIISSVGASIADPFKYLYNHSKNVWAGKPSDAEVLEYGKQLGNVTQMIVGAVAGGGAIGAKLVQTLGKVCPKFMKLVDKVGDVAQTTGKTFEGGLCFTGDTLIQTKDGYKEIKDIKVGDEVYSANLETGEKGLKKVKNVFINETDTLIHVFVGKEEIRTTPTHPFWVEGKGWVAAGELQVGDKVSLYNGKNVDIKKTIVEKLDEAIMVYNFEVEDWHTYFVSEQNVLVHNSCMAKWKTIVEEKSASRVADSLSASQRKIYTNTLAKLANGDTSGLNVHLRTDGYMSADLKGFGGGRGNSRIYYTEVDGKITVQRIDLAHQ